MTARLKSTVAAAMLMVLASGPAGAGNDAADAAQAGREAAQRGIDRYQADIEGIRRRVETLQGQARSLPPLTAPRSDVGGAVRDVLGVSPIPTAQGEREEGRRVTLLVSWALGESALKDLLQAVAGRQDVQVIFRGLPPGQRLGAAIARLRQLVDPSAPIANVSIDPPRWRRLGGSDTVPEMIVSEGDKVLARARGSFDVDGFLARVEQGQLGDLGAFGPTVTAEESDLVEDLQKRMASVDFGAARERMRRETWKRLPMFDLPVVVEGRERFLDLTIEAPRDIVAPDGRLVAKAGRRVNPLELHSFGYRLIAFDGRDRRQVAVAARQAQSAGGRRVVLMTTMLDRENGNADLAALEERLGAPVYLLTSDMRQRFGIERVPSIVEGAGKALRILEIKPDQEEK